jgi:hypothetical protein
MDGACGTVSYRQACGRVPPVFYVDIQFVIHVVGKCFL